MHAPRERITATNQSEELLQRDRRNLLALGQSRRPLLLPRRSYWHEVFVLYFSVSPNKIPDRPVDSRMSLCSFNSKL